VSVVGLSNINCTESLDAQRLQVLFITTPDQPIQQNDQRTSSSLHPTNSSKKTINRQVHRHQRTTGSTSPVALLRLTISPPNPASHDGLRLPRHRQARGVNQQHDPVVLLDSSAFKPQTKPSPESSCPRHLKTLHGPLDILLLRRRGPRRAPRDSTRYRVFHRVERMQRTKLR
jgi:hypothetical protein